jgi:hypothetical protein
MSDVRLVRLRETRYLENFADGCYFDNPNGTHLLVPVGKIKDLVSCGWNRDGSRVIRRTVMVDLGIKDCPTCGGSGEEIRFGQSDSGEPGFIRRRRDGAVFKCPDCNGRGWVLEGGNDE